MKIKRKEILLASGFFIVIICIFFYRVVFLGEHWVTTNLLNYFAPWKSLSNEQFHTTLLSDAVDFFLPAIQHWKTSILQGRFPLWNPYISMGIPFYHSSTALTGYFLNWLFVFLPVQDALGIHAMIRLFISAFGMYIFLRELKLSRTPSIFGSVAYTFSGPMIVWLNWPHTYVSVFAPLLMFLIERLIKTGKLKYFIGVSVTLATMFYGYMPAYVGYFLYIAGFYFLIRMSTLYPIMLNWKAWVKRGLQLVTSIIFGIGLAAFHIIPFLDIINGGGYIEERRSLYETSLSFDYLITYFVPRIFNGSGVKRVHFNEYTSYVGLITLFFAGFSIYKPERNKRIIYVFALLSILLFSFVYGAPTSAILKYFPILNSSISLRLVMPLAFILSVLAALAIDNVKNYDLNELLKPILIYSFCFLSLMLGLIIYEKYLFADKLNTKYLIWAGFLYFFIAAVILMYVVGRLKVKVFSALINIILIVDLFSFGITYNPTVPVKGQLYPETDSIRFLESNLGDFKFVALGDWTLFPNSSMIYGFQDLRGHDFFLRNNRISEFMHKIDPNSYKSPTRTEINEINNEHLLDLAGVKYVLTENSLDEKMVEDNLQHTNGSVPVGEIYGKSVIKQTFVATHNDLKGIDVLLANYRHTLGDQFVYLDLTDDLGQVIAKCKVEAYKIQDNKYHRFDFTTPIKDSKGKKFTFSIHSEKSVPKNAITAWMSKANTYYKGQASIDNHTIDGDLFFRTYYYSKTNFNLIKEFNDGLIIYKNSNALPLIYFTTSPKSAEGNNDIQELNKLDVNKEVLLENYSGNALKTKSTSKADISFVRQRPEELNVKISCDSEGVLVLNENFHSGWEAYIDGKEVEIYQANYLFKGILVPSGEHSVKFNFNPDSVKDGIVITFSTIALLSILFAYKVIFLKKQVDN